MHGTTPPREHGRRPRPRRRAGLALLGIGLLTGAAIPALTATNGADACTLPQLQRSAVGASPNAECTHPTTSIRTTTTTAPGPPTTTTPPAPNWFAAVSVLDESTLLPTDPNSYRGVSKGTWTRDRDSRDVRQEGTVAWDDPNVQNHGQLALTNPQVLPGTAPVGFSLFEQNRASGALCRSMPFPAIPPSGPSSGPSEHQVHAIVAPPVPLSPTELNTQAAGATGSTITPVAGVTVKVNNFTLTPNDDGTIAVALDGHAEAKASGIAIDGSFSYTASLLLSPSMSVADPHEVVSVSMPWAGNLDTNGDTLFDSIALHFVPKDQLESAFREGLRSAISGAFNQTIATKPQAAWFAFSGYTASMRAVTTTHDGVVLLPSLCKFD
jgi:hypothetical protein